MASLGLFLISIVNLILLWKLFNVVNMRFVVSIFAKQIVTSTYLFHILILFSKHAIMVIFRFYHENIFQHRFQRRTHGYAFSINTNLTVKTKMRIFVHKYNRSFISRLGMVVSLFMSM